MTANMNPKNTGKKAEAIAADAWNTRKLNPYRLAAIEETVSKSFLDVGCGNGAYVLALKDKFRTFGVDIKRYSPWDEAENHFDTCDAAKLPLADNSFDTVTSFEVLEHVPDPVETLREFSRVATKNIIFSVPNCEIPEALVQSRLTYFHYTDPSHLNFFTESDLRTTCESAGLIVNDVRRINPCNMLPLASSLLGIKSGFGQRILRRFFRDQFFMTFLVIANVPAENT